MEESRQRGFERGCPSLRDDLYCRYCDRVEEKFSWQECIHYGTYGNPKAGLWGQWKNELMKSNGYKPGDTSFFSDVLQDFRDDLLNDQIHFVEAEISRKSPELVLCLSRHAWPLDSSLSGREKFRAIQIFPSWLEIGSYDLLFSHSLHVLDLIYVHFSHLEDLDVVIYIGSNCTPQFAFNDALQKWLSHHSDVNWKFWNLFEDFDYLDDSEKVKGYHMAPNCSQWKS